MCENHPIARTENHSPMVNLVSTIKSLNANAYSTLRVNNEPGHSRDELPGYRLSGIHDYHFSQWR